MRILGIDLGSKTMGLAITDSQQNIACGLGNFTYPKHNLEVCIHEIRRILKEYTNEITTIVLGYPLKLNGNKSESTFLVEKFEQKLKQHFKDLKIIRQDESFSTLDATAILKFECKMKSSQIKNIKDKMSATIILNRYLELNKKC
jgi:putative Holliday junction resolvase